jgi:hypothetical protein
MVVQPDKGVLALIQVTVKFVDFGGIFYLLLSVSNMVTNGAWGMKMKTI